MQLAFEAAESNSQMETSRVLNCSDPEGDPAASIPIEKLTSENDE